jgi:hypothetical protein
MSTISHYDPDCQEEIPVEWPVWDQRTNEPTATPLTDLMAAGSDPAGMDAEVMPYEDWVEIHGVNGRGDKLDEALVDVPRWEHEPEYQYFEEVTA